MHARVLNDLADFAAEIHIDTMENRVREALEKNLIDSFAVAAAGMNTPELRDLRKVWPQSEGPSSILGTDLRSLPETSIALNASALCVLELDEGNKYARGHPGAHVLPAALAEAQHLGASGPEFMSALLAGYEVATRIARNFSPRPGLHPHGHWGAVGAAISVGRLHGFSPTEMAQAMDAAAGLPLATPFSSALSGSFVRNTWMGVAGNNGLTAARIVMAGLGSTDATGLATFDDLLGTIETDEITAELGTRWEITGGYFKRHSSCNYTHPPADAAIELALSGEFDPASISGIQVDTHALALRLQEHRPRTRLAAMFSIPHVVAVALVKGACQPESFSPEHLDDPEIARLRELVSIEFDNQIDSRRPAERGARVTITNGNDRTTSAQVPNSIGDADHFPFSKEQIIDKANALVGPERAERIATGVANLRQITDMADVGFLG